MAGRNQKAESFVEEIDEAGRFWENQLHFLTMYILGCTQRECKPNESNIVEYRKMFESRISAGATEQLPGWEKTQAKTVAWSYVLERHAKNAKKDVANWRIKRQNSCIKSQLFACTTTAPSGRADYKKIKQQPDLFVSGLKLGPAC